MELREILKKNGSVHDFNILMNSLKSKDVQQSKVLYALFDTCARLNPENNPNFATYLLIGGYAVLGTILKRSRELKAETGDERFSPENIIPKWRGSHDIDLLSSPEVWKEKIPQNLYNYLPSSNRGIETGGVKYSFVYNGEVPGDVYMVPFGKKIRIAQAEFERTPICDFEHETLKIFGINIFIPRSEDLIKAKLTGYVEGCSARDWVNNMQEKRPRDVSDITNVIACVDSRLDGSKFNEKQKETIELILKSQKYSEETILKGSRPLNEIYWVRG